MFPELFSSSYKQYKNDTSAFTTWLGRAAEACGYKPQPKETISETVTETPTKSTKSTKLEPEAPNAASTVTTAPVTRLKGKARKLAKQAQTQAQPKVPTQPELKPEKISIETDHVRTVKEYSVTTQELQEQIDLVSQAKSKISMPSGIQKVLERAIDARKRCSEWIESTKVQAAFDNGGHSHFIDLLQEALSKLSTQASSEKQPAARPARPAATTKTTISDLVNRFSALEVEDADESFELSPTQVAVATRPHTTNEGDYDVDVFTLHADEHYENAFAVYCFLEDLHRIQHALRQTWVDCASGRTPLVVATAVTQSAIRVIQRGENDILPTLLHDGDDAGSYFTLLTAIVYHEEVKGNGGLAQIQGSEALISPFGDFIFLSAARILGKFARQAQLNQTGGKGKNFCWPPPVLPIAVEQDGESPELRQLREDDAILTQLLLEQELPDWVNLEFQGNKRPEGAPELWAPVNEDIFFKTMRPVWLTGKLSLTAVVTAQIMVDIHHTCGKGLSAFNPQLLHAASYMNDTYGLNGVDAPGFPRGLTWSSQGTEAVGNACDALDLVSQPRIPLAKVVTQQTYPERKVYEKMDGSYAGTPDTRKSRPETAVKPKQNYIRPSSEENFAITHNPLFSGGMTLRLLLHYHETGLIFANSYSTIFLAAHLYNGLRQLKMLETPWPVMDRIIQLHKSEIFANDIPTKESDMADRITYRLNLSTVKKQKYSKWMDKIAFKEPNIAETLRLMLKEDARYLDLALWKIEQEVEKQNKSAVVLAKSSSALQLRRNQRVTADQYFASLQSVFTSAFDDLSIDYIRLTKTCWELLDRFRNLYNAETALRAPDIRFDEYHQGSKLNGFANVVHECFEETKSLRGHGLYAYAAGDGGDQAQRGRLFHNSNNPDRHGMGMKAATAAFTAFLKDGDTELVFPLKMPDSKLLEAVEASNSASVLLEGKVERLHSAAEFHSVLASSTYVVVHLYTDYSKAHDPFILFAQARKHAVEGIFTFVRANADDMHEEAMKYCKDLNTAVYVFFQNGKQVSVNGKITIEADDSKALRAAVAKISKKVKAIVG